MSNKRNFVETQHRPVPICSRRVAIGLLAAVLVPWVLGVGAWCLL